MYYLYDVPSDGSRGGHAHKKLNQFLIPLSGSFDVIVDDGSSKKTFSLNLMLAINNLLKKSVINHRHY